MKHPSPERQVKFEKVQQRTRNQRLVVHRNKALRTDIEKKYVSGVEKYWVLFSVESQHSSWSGREMRVAENLLMTLANYILSEKVTNFEDLKVGFGDPFVQNLSMSNLLVRMAGRKRLCQWMDIRDADPCVDRIPRVLHTEGGGVA